MSKNAKSKHNGTPRVRNSKPRGLARECSRNQREAIEEYVARHVGPARRVLHEIESHIVHIDVHIVPPGTDHPFWFLFTTGMSALPMNSPMEHPAYAELSLMLPTWWQIDMGRWKQDKRWFWPIRELIDLARYPHRMRTWLGQGHTVASGQPARPYDRSTSLAAMLVLPWSFSEDVIHGDVATQLYALWPLHADELDYKRAHGLMALCDCLEAAGVTAELDPSRPSSVASAALADLGFAN